MQSTEQQQALNKVERSAASDGPGRSSNSSMTETGGALTFQVKPWDESTDLDLIDRSIHALESNLPGVRFAKTFAKEDIAFGIKALTCVAFIPPDMSTDRVFEWVRDLTEPNNTSVRLVSSVDLIAFQNA
jgi:hypothetical protein